MHKKPRRIVTIERRRNQLQKRIVSYIKTRDRLIKELSELKAPSTEEWQEFEKCDIELKRHTIELIQNRK